MKKSTSVANAQLEAIEATIGASAVMKIFSGAAPASTSDADAGTLLASLNLPADWMGNASGRSKALAGTWQDTAADGNGTAGYWRIYAAGGTTCHLQGSLSLALGGGELILDSLSFSIGQSFSVNSFSIAAGGA